MPCTSRRCLLDETRTALLSPRLRNAYGHDDEGVDAWCADVRGIGEVFEGSLPDIGATCRDPNDDHVIATALAVQAEFIVTDDKDLLALGRFRTVRIVTARAFLLELGKRG